jgi:hypothetical protein
MVDHKERFSTSFVSPFSSDLAGGAAAAPSATRWIAWMPLLFVAAFLYWSVALGLGGLSLMAASALSGDIEVGGTTPDFGATALEPVPGHLLGDTIVVHLEESAEPEDVNDNAGAVAPNDTIDSADDDDGTGRLPGQNRN